VAAADAERQPFLITGVQVPCQVYSHSRQTRKSCYMLPVVVATK
jgi:hypothetical protein